MSATELPEPQSGVGQPFANCPPRPVELPFWSTRLLPKPKSPRKSAERLRFCTQLRYSNPSPKVCFPFTQVTESPNCQTGTSLVEASLPGLPKPVKPEGFILGYSR